MSKQQLFYKPNDGWAGDFIPFFHKGGFWLYYLHDFIDKGKHGKGTPWYLISTDDFCNFTEYGEVIPRGTVDKQDMYVFTGSVLEADGKFHIFYTGHNTTSEFQEQGKPRQGIMHAVSKDLIQWSKVSGEIMLSPGGIYERDDWRDPFVFWNEKAKEYWMLITARLAKYPSRRSGCIALYTSPDLKNWDLQDPFWRPNLYNTHECPDLFRMGDWWYLVYSAVSERLVTHYRMSKSLQGPWTAPENDTFDSRNYYAAKTASDGKRRYTFGWNARREEGKDSGSWQWGGSLVVHELVQNTDGSLGVKCPQVITGKFTKSVKLELTKVIGKCDFNGNKAKIDVLTSYGCVGAGSFSDCCRLEADLTFSEYTRGCGIVFCADDDYEEGYYARLEPGRNRLVFDSYRSSLAPVVELERPLELVAGQMVKMIIMLQDDSVVIYVNDEIALSARMYERSNKNWGVFVSEGKACFKLACKQAPDLAME